MFNLAPTSDIPSVQSSKSGNEAPEKDPARACDQVGADLERAEESPRTAGAKEKMSEAEPAADATLSGAGDPESPPLKRARASNEVNPPAPPASD